MERPQMFRVPTRADELVQPAWYDAVQGICLGGGCRHRQATRGGPQPFGTTRFAVDPRRHEARKHHDTGRCSTNRSHALP